MNEKLIVERAILTAIQEGKGNHGWYNIAIKLSKMDVPREFDLMECLLDLEARNLIRKLPKEGSNQGRWELTDQGVTALEQTQG